jgi:hypothetical protein
LTLIQLGFNAGFAGANRLAASTGTLKFLEPADMAMAPRLRVAEFGAGWQSRISRQTTGTSGDRERVTGIRGPSVLSGCHDGYMGGVSHELSAGARRFQPTSLTELSRYRWRSYKACSQTITGGLEASDPRTFETLRGRTQLLCEERR